MNSVNEEDTAKQLLEKVDRGLGKGLCLHHDTNGALGAAINFVLRPLKSDNPPWPAEVLWQLSCELNSAQWHTEQSRSRGLRRLALAQLGTMYEFNEGQFIAQLCRKTRSCLLPALMKDVADRHAEFYENKFLQAAGSWVKAVSVGEVECTISAAQAIRDESQKNLTALLNAIRRCETEGSLDAVDAGYDALVAVFGDVYGDGWQQARRRQFVPETTIYKLRQACLDSRYENEELPVPKPVNNLIRWSAVGNTLMGLVASLSSIAYYDELNSCENNRDSAGRCAAPTRDKILAAFAEVVVQVLIEMDSPGTKFLYLTEAADLSNAVN